MRSLARRLQKVVAARIKSTTATKDTIVKVAITAALFPQNPREDAPAAAGSLVPVPLGLIGNVCTPGSVSDVGGGSVLSMVRVVAGTVRRTLADDDRLVEPDKDVIVVALLEASKIEGDSEIDSLCDEADVDDEEVTGSDEEGVIDGGVVEGVKEGDGEEKVAGGGVTGDVSKTGLLDGVTSEDEGPGRGSVELEKGSSDVEEFASCLGHR